jgi:hypothetical protein
MAPDIVIAWFAVVSVATPPAPPSATPDPPLSVQEPDIVIIPEKSVVQLIAPPPPAVAPDPPDTEIDALDTMSPGSEPALPVVELTAPPCPPTPETVEAAPPVEVIEPARVTKILVVVNVTVPPIAGEGPNFGPVDAPALAVMDEAEVSVMDPVAPSAKNCTEPPGAPSNVNNELEVSSDDPPVASIVALLLRLPPLAPHRTCTVPPDFV